MLKYSRRVEVYAAHCDRIVYWAEPRQAEAAVDCGQAKIILELRRKKAGVRYKVVRSIRLTGQLVDIAYLGLKPGSFGIRREQTGSGVVYAHNSAWSQMAGKKAGS